MHIDFNDFDGFKDIDNKKFKRLEHDRKIESERQATTNDKISAVRDRNIFLTERVEKLEKTIESLVTLVEGLEKIIKPYNLERWGEWYFITNRKNGDKESFLIKADAHARWKELTGEELNFITSDKSALPYL